MLCKIYQPVNFNKSLYYLDIYVHRWIDHMLDFYDHKSAQLYIAIYNMHMLVLML